jgi:hypothetical protein
MILGVYATLGVFLLIASRNPFAHGSLIWFTVWSSVVHAGIMGAQALANSEHMAHLWGDVPLLLALAGILALLARRARISVDSGAHLDRLEAASRTGRAAALIQQNSR